MGFWARASAVDERARTDFGRAGQNLYDDTDDGVVVVAAELALAEAGERRREVSGCLGTTSNFVRILKGERGLTQEPRNLR